MAFTLVELLVVIAIIIVLASLLLAAVFKALDLANEAATRTDITQIASGVKYVEMSGWSDTMRSTQPAPWETSSRPRR